MLEHQVLHLNRLVQPANLSNLGVCGHTHTQNVTRPEAAGFHCTSSSTLPAKMPAGAGPLGYGAQVYSHRCPQPAGQCELLFSQFMMCSRCPPWLQPWHHTNSPFTTWWQTAQMLAHWWHLGNRKGWIKERSHSLTPLWLTFKTGESRRFEAYSLQRSNFLDPETGPGCTGSAATTKHHEPSCAHDATPPDPPVADPALVTHGSLAVAAVNVQCGGSLVQAVDGTACAQLDDLVGDIPQLEALQQVDVGHVPVLLRWDKRHPGHSVT